ncbi:MAG: hypothetical protein V1791_15870 [Pseudomonadota bacterium]
MTEATEHNWQALAEAIILQAVADYRRARYRNSKRPHQAETLQEIQSIEQFFCSELFAVLCTLEGRRLLHDLNKQMEDTK